ncbi:MAG: nucleotide exchange factor GrpE [Methyloceanibacter sp.]
MPDDKTDPRETSEDQPKSADAPKAAPRGSSPEPEGPVEADLDALLAENADMRDRLLRTMADMENLRHRTEREKSDTARYAISNFARDVLTIGDNLRRTIEHVPGEAAAQDPALKSFLEGVELTERELLNMMERHGVVRIEPLGQRFDPNCQQAMYEVPNAEVPDGTVVEVMQSGYMIGDRCLRPALVAVAKGGGKPAPQPKGNGQSGPARRAANDDAPGGTEPGEEKGD